METIVNWLAWLLLPPKTVVDVTVYNWALRMAYTTIAVVMTLGLYAAAAFGFLPGIIFSGFATTSSVAAVQAQIAATVATTKQEMTQKLDEAKGQVLAIQLGQLDSKIVDTRGKQCKAIAERNESAKGFAEDRLQYQLQQYFRLSGFAYRIPDCLEL